MQMILSHMSAYEYWTCSSDLHGGSICSLPPDFQMRTSVAETNRFMAEYGISKPLHVFVPDAGQRRKPSARYVSYTGTIPAKSLVRIAPGVYVTSPEYCFVQLATKLNERDLVIAALHLCSSYALDARNENGLRWHRPVTTLRNLTRFADKNPSLPGAKDAARALRFAMDDCAFPTQLKAVAALCLPRRLGGFGLTQPRLNHRLELSEAGAALLRRPDTSCDLYWPDAKLVLDYCGPQHHSRKCSEARASRRRSALESSGCQVITLRDEDFATTDALNDLGKRVLKAMGVRQGAKPKEYAARQAALVERLG
ncbi:MAG: hypothetical protein IJJ14_01565 [Coriobacteriales bacterium]|nr:hypothetical protein [Coriobacteriales bacterium]MBQ6586954.1 hypothetical protein [Coriobacteriales bacterium]